MIRSQTAAECRQFRSSNSTDIVQSQQGVDDLYLEQKYVSVFETWATPEQGHTTLCGVPAVFETLLWKFISPACALVRSDKCMCRAIALLYHVKKNLRNQSRSIFSPSRLSVDSTKLWPICNVFSWCCMMQESPSLRIGLLWDELFSAERTRCAAQRSEGAHFYLGRLMIGLSVASHAMAKCDRYGIEFLIWNKILLLPCWGVLRFPGEEHQDTWQLFHPRTGLTYRVLLACFLEW